MAAAISAEGKRKVLVGILSILGAVTWLNFVFFPQWSRFSRLQGEIRSLKRQVVRLRQDLAEWPALEENRKQLEAQVRMPAAAVPPEQQLPDLLERITQAARLSEVRLVGLKPRADLGSVRPGGSGYIEMPLEILTTAGYHPMGRFLDRLESSDDLLRVQKLEIQSDSQDAWNHSATVLLVAYLAPAS